MVSIAESLITESLNANGAWEKFFVNHPRACRTSVSNGTSAGQSSQSNCGSFPPAARKQESPGTGETGADFGLRPVRPRPGVCCAGSCGFRFSFRGGPVPLGNPTLCDREVAAAHGTKPKKKTLRFYFFKCVCSLFTDLSAAGLPAELKHITQRRKRKQP